MKQAALKILCLLNKVFRLYSSDNLNKHHFKFVQKKEQLMGSGLLMYAELLFALLDKNSGGRI